VDRVIVIGGGFGGIAVLKKLRACRIHAEVTLIDKKASFDFLPELPDVIGRRIDPEHLVCDLKELGGNLGAEFIQAEVSAVDLDKREILAGAQKLSYDYLVIASGSETNFYGQEAIKKYAYKLDSVEDTLSLNSVVKSGSFDNFIISGGGYTGMEVATNLWKYCHDKKAPKNIVIVERAASLLGPLPQNLKSYTVANIERLGIKAVLNTTISKIEEKQNFFV
jgi:NADH:ubiquinone reductase (H+-translocating)